MRTDVKVGLICLFLLALGLVCFFTLRNNKTKQDIVTSSVPVSPIPAATPAAEPSSGSLTPPAGMVSPTTAPSVAAADGAAAPMLAAPADVQPPANTYGGLIAPPGASTAPSLSTPTLPSNGPSLNTSLVPPASHAGSGTPTLTSPLNTGASAGSLLPAPSSPAPATPSAPVPGNTINLDNAPRRNPLDLSTTPTTPSAPAAARTPSSPSMDFPSDTAGPAGAGGSYAVKKGDTLAGIARKNHVTLKALETANPGVNPNRLKINQKLNLPGASSGTSSSMAESTSSPTVELGGAPAARRPATPRKTSKTFHKTTVAKAKPAKRHAPSGGTYTVKKGDTLGKIAKTLYGDEALWRRIFRANRGELSSPNDLRAGEVIRLPK